jgi:hypothetical protein
VYADILRACLDSNGICTAFITWGFSDFSTWLGTDQYPLFFDTDFCAKPAFHAMMKVLDENYVESTEVCPEVDEVVVEVDFAKSLYAMATSVFAFTLLI